MIYECIVFDFDDVKQEWITFCPAYNLYVRNKSIVEAQTILISSLERFLNKSQISVNWTWAGKFTFGEKF